MRSRRRKEKDDPENSPKDALKRKSSGGQGCRTKTKKGKAASLGARTAQAMNNFHQAMVVGKQMLGWITEAPAWDWANTEKTVAPLREAMQGLEGCHAELEPL